MPRRYIMENIQENKLAKDATLREHFAGLAMQGMVGSDIWVDAQVNQICTQAVEIADALLKELEK